jgi:hypothetical protein
MNSESPDRDLIFRYLLGYTSQEEAEAIATRLFSDDSFAEALEDAENDLLDAYSRGELSTADRTAVRVRLLHSERLIHKLALARVLAEREGKHQHPKAKRWLIWAAVAAALLLVAAGLLWRNSASRELHVAAPALPPAPAIQPQPKPVPAFAALLSPGALRGGDVQQVKLPPQAAAVRFDLLLEAPSAAPSYSVHLEKQRQTILDQPDLLAHTEGSTLLVSVVLETATLTPGTYRLYLTAPQQPRLTYSVQIR